MNVAVAPSAALQAQAGDTRPLDLTMKQAFDTPPLDLTMKCTVEPSAALQEKAGDPPILKVCYIFIYFLYIMSYIM